MPNNDGISDFIDRAISELNIRDGIVLYTDGILEARNIYKEQSDTS